MITTAAVYTETADRPAPRRRGLAARVRALLHVRADSALSAAPPATPATPGADGRQRLLSDLNRAVAESPDDVPLRETLDRLNHPYSD